MSVLQQFMDKLLGFDKKKDKVHAANNHYTAQLIKEHTRIRQLLEEQTYYRIGKSSGRIP